MIASKNNLLLLLYCISRGRSPCQGNDLGCAIHSALSSESVDSVESIDS